MKHYYLYSLLLSLPLFLGGHFVQAQEVKKTAAVPKIEALSLYGNPVDYTVKGRTYKVMLSAKNYIKKGIASWYGSDFHKKKTSSGEVYDMYAMTAAHKTLPLPTYVRVKNLENGRMVIVKVNDRGPFHSDRIIDLSYAAAKQLGMSVQGTAKVEVEALFPASQKEPLAAQYYIQVAAYSGQELASHLQKKLETVIQHPVQVSKKAKHFVVLVGPLLNANIFSAVTIELQQLGFDKTIASLR